MKRRFHIGDVLTVVTAKLVSPRMMEGVYDILLFLHGTPIWTNQIPRAFEDARPFIYEQLPQLKDVDASAVTPDNWRGWLTEQVEKYGEHVTLSPIPHAEELRRDPREELEERVGRDRIVVVSEESE